MTGYKVTELLDKGFDLDELRRLTGNPGLTEDSMVRTSQKELKRRQGLPAEELQAELGGSTIAEPAHRLHAVSTILGDIREPVAAGQMVAELDIPLERVLALVGMETPGGSETIVDAVVVRAANEQNKQRVAESQSGALVQYNARQARVASGRRPRGNRADKAIKDHIFEVVANVLRHTPYRPDGVVRREGGSRTVAFMVPSLLDPDVGYVLDPMEFRALEADPTASFPVVTEQQEYELIGELSQLSSIPKACQNCGQDDDFFIGLRNKFWLLIDGLVKREESGEYILRFYLPGMKRRWTALYKELGLPTDYKHFQELGFRKVHDECGIIAHELQGLVESSEFAGADWFDDEVRRRFIKALGRQLQGRLAEIKQKTRDKVGARTVTQRATGITREVFSRLDTARANREAGRARFEGVSNV